MIELSKKFDIEKIKQELEADRITIGLAICGRASGGWNIYEQLKSANLRLPVEITGCIGMCHNEPIVTVKQNNITSVYGRVNPGNVDKLIDCIKNNRECKELLICHDLNELDFYKKQKRLVMENCGVINPFKIEHYVAKGGYFPLKKILMQMSPKEVVEEIKKSGLRGRGGGGFPVWQKWSFVVDKQGKKYMICNADEGDPGAFMNKTVMVSDPFRVIEGMTIAAYAIGADEGYIYARAESPLVIETMEKAIASAYSHNLLGKNILGFEGFNFDVHLQRGAGAFVCGEETALLNSIEGKRGMPRPRPPYPADFGLFGKPTVVNNVGTLAHVATVFKIGAEEYAKTGTEKSKGTKEICLTGRIARSGIIEVPLGMTIREIVFGIGGGCPDGREMKAVLTGGPAGGCIPKEFFDTPLDYETLQQHGSIMGSGGIVALSDESCMVEVARFFMSFTQSESCGKCTPCREGTKRLLEMITNITRGVGEEADLEKIRLLAEFVRDNSLCGLGQNAPNPILSTLRFFRNEYITHIKNKECCAGACKSLMKYIITDKCVGCGNCAKHCPVQCISGEPRKKYVIDQSKCIKCGTCQEVCAFKAVIKK
jgi:NADH:ubiquinone oxidoreductase subunit F (NADH-binding)/(2Fe-2S) ferredoxin